MKLRVVTGLIMGTLMSFLMSGAITAVNTGLDAGFIARWARSSAIVWVLAVPLALFLSPIAQKWAKALTNTH